MGYLNLVVNAFKSLRSSKATIQATEALYKKASAVVDKIPETRLQQAVDTLFRPQGKTHTFFDDLEKIQKTVAENNVPKEIKNAFENIKSHASSYSEECEKGVISGKVPSHESYSCKVQDDFDAITNYAYELTDKNIGNKDFDKYLNLSKEICNLRYSSPYDARIGRLKDGVLPKNGVLYHGTKQPRTILKTGFSEQKSNQVAKASREFGAGVYLTPDRKVASHFAGIRGRIMSVKADIKNTAAVNNAQFSTLASQAGSLLSETGYSAGTKEGNAVMELIMKRLFNKAGYDSVYTSNSMASGLFAKSADEWLGRAQSQLVVFDGAKVMPAGKKPFIQKIKDELLQIGTRFKVVYNILKMQVKDPIGCMLGM